MLDLIEPSNKNSTNPDVSAAIVANFLELSALDSDKPIIGASGAIRFLVKTLMGSNRSSRHQSQVVQDSLRALYNLSILASNVALMIEIDGFVAFLLTELGETDFRVDKGKQTSENYYAGGSCGGSGGGAIYGEDSRNGTKRMKPTAAGSESSAAAPPDSPDPMVLVDSQETVALI